MSELPKIIDMKGIKQVYPSINGDVTIIDGLDFLIEDEPDVGEFNIILGPSGCGKSTVLRYAAGLQAPTEGTVLVNEKPPGPGNQVGMVFQKYSSFPWLTVLDNVAYGLRIQGVAKKERNERAMEMIKSVGLEGNENKYAQYPSLSGGQLQRVAIARSLLSNPESLLMDEPFGALDIKTKLQMQELLAQIFQDMQPTIVMVTHDISEAVFLADKIYIMDTAPSFFKYELDIRAELGAERTRETKRSPIFTKMVHHIEDIMMSLEA